VYVRRGALLFKRDNRRGFRLLHPDVFAGPLEASRKSVSEQMSYRWNTAIVLWPETVIATV